MSLVCITQTEGADGLPKQGGCILAMNHLGRMDVLFAYTAVPRSDMILTVAEKYQKVAFFRWAARSLNALFIDRYNNDLKTLRQVIRRLQTGEVLGIAPEGTRSQTEQLISGKPGAAYIAAKTGVPVFPTAVTGSEDRVVLANLKRLKRTPVSIKIGTPFYIPALPKKGRDEALQAHTEEIMCQIAALLPAKYHGVYQNHPRIAELQQQTAFSEIN